MTQEDKNLLLKDLCARLPYGFKVKCGSEILTFNVNWLQMFQYHLDEIKPYLRPMSSMTEKETYIFRQDILNDVEARCIHSLGCGKYSVAFTEANDWLNEHHFDFRDLIEKGLALEAPEGMYKTE